MAIPYSIFKGSESAVGRVQSGWIGVLCPGQDPYQLPEALDSKRIVVLRIPDAYAFMDPDLIDELKAKVLPHLGLTDA